MPEVMEWAEAVRIFCSRASLHTGLRNGTHSVVTDSKLLPSVPLLSLQRALMGKGKGTTK